MLDPEKIREDFPILKERRIVYFDNAATTQKPRQVIEAVKRFYERHNANIHRGLHDLSQEASELYEEAHRVVARFIGARDMSEVVFTRNTTESLNLVAYTLALSRLGPGDNVVTTIMEHHSGMLPWIYLSRLRGFEVRLVKVTGDGELDYGMLEELVDNRTRVVAVTHVSNMLGTVNDVRRIARVAHSVGAYLVVDAAQSAPHMKLNVREMDVDFLAFSGHKMLGPTGIGVLYAKREHLEELPPFLYGGDMVRAVHYVEGRVEAKWNELPWKYEAGTPNIVGGVGLMEAVRYLERIGMENIEQYERRLTTYLLKRLEELGDRIEVYGPRDPSRRTALAAFNVRGMDPHAVAAALNAYGIAVRSGYHCTQPLHEYLGIKKGSARASLYIYNTMEEIDYFIEALSSIASKS